ncbi:hypothetical protein, partial [Burkholderia vietnamiensis]|uniref:hypothetical protein n=1 Tax=Burkholderia vietnamiensis TaxID=60552 RepID=UPI001ABBD28E
IYDNMKTAVDKVGRGKERAVNARFEAMCGHYRGMNTVSVNSYHNPFGYENGSTYYDMAR